MLTVKVQWPMSLAATSAWHNWASLSSRTPSKSASRQKVRVVPFLVAPADGGNRRAPADRFAGQLNLPVHQQALIAFPAVSRVLLNLPRKRLDTSGSGCCGMNRLSRQHCYVTVATVQEKAPPSVGLANAGGFGEGNGHGGAGGNRHCSESVLPTPDSRVNGDSSRTAWVVLVFQVDGGSSAEANIRQLCPACLVYTASVLRIGQWHEEP